jgi:TolB-like protein/DNA-binding winged helix-turn-helix (wHTH) protein
LIKRFGAFELDLRSAELRKDGIVVKLQPQPFRVLALLVDRAGELVTRDELKKALWGDETYVDFERGLNFCINQVRGALGDSADSPTFVQTLPRRGYRFIAGVGSESVQSESTDRLKDQGRAASRWQLVTAGMAFLAIIVVLASYLARRVTPAAAPQGGDRRMVAVLPLDDLTGDQTSAWFADGLTEEVIAQLGRVSPDRLGVIARTSAMTYRASGKTVAEIGRELRVTHVLEGSLRRDRDRLRITMQLVDVSDQAPVWSETFDRTMHGSLTLQSEVAAHVTRALAVELLPASWTTPTWAATGNPDARDAYLRGRYFAMRGQPGDLQAALGHYQDATRLDSSFAAAFAAQADTYHLLAMFGRMAPADAYPRAIDAARTAVRLDSNLSASHTAMGITSLWADWNPAAAAASFTRALALNPSDAAAHHDFAWALVALQRFDEAVTHITRARDLDPVSPRASNDIGWLYLQIRQPSEALRACRQTLALDPESVEAQQCLERAYHQRGELSEAIAAARAAAARARGAVPAVHEDAGSPDATLRAIWRQRLDRLLALERNRYINPYTIAMHHAVLEEDDEAIARLEHSLETRVGMMVLLSIDPVFDRLRAHPRFIKLIDEVRRRQE